MKTNTSTMVQKLILTGLMTALVTVATMFLAFPVPFTNGYIHLGDSMLFLSVIILGWKYGAFAAGVGSAMADIYLGYVHWAPWTLCIKGLMAMVMGIIICKAANSKKGTAIACSIIGGFWLAFNFGVQKIIQIGVDSNSQTLMEEAQVATTTEFGEFINSMQSQLMVVALVIPIALLAIAWIINKRENIVIPISQILAMSAAGLFMVFGYYVAGGILYGNFAVAAFSIPANMIQFISGFLIAAIVSAALAKTPVYKFFEYRILTKPTYAKTEDGSKN